MKLEYIAEGCVDCPLIRLYEFDRDQAAAFKSALERLRSGEQQIQLHNEPFIETVGDCKLTLKKSARDWGIVLNGREFECSLTSEAWDDLVFWVEPFCNSDSGSYQWLPTPGGRKIRLLLSRNGQW
jgi:hypothetical protein